MPAAPTAAMLIEAAKTALGVKTDDELARALERRYGVSVKQSTVNRWQTLNKPSYDATMAMLDAAGWLNTAAEPPSIVPAADPQIGLLERIAAAVTALALNQEAGLDALGVPADARVPLPPDVQRHRARPKRK